MNKSDPFKAVRDLDLKESRKFKEVTDFKPKGLGILKEPKTKVMSTGELQPGNELDANAGVTSRLMTFGECLVGLNFNPAGDDKVAKAKRLCAELADLLHEELDGKETTQLTHVLINPTYSKILDAQMSVVKILTLKY